MCSCRSPLRRACPPPLHIKKAFDSKWHKVTRRAPKEQGTQVYTIPLHPDPLHPSQGGSGCREWGDGKRDILSALAPQSGCAGGWYRLKRKSLSGNSTSLPRGRVTRAVGPIPPLPRTAPYQTFGTVPAEGTGAKAASTASTRALRGLTTKRRSSLCRWETCPTFSPAGL